MTAGAGAAPPEAPALPGLTIRPPALWLTVALAAGAAAAAGIAPFAILTVVLLVACGAGVLHSPLVFLWIMTAISGIGLGWTDSAALDIAGRRINVNGLRWALVIATSVVVLVRMRGATIPRELRGWAAFVLLSAIGVLWAPNGFEALKQFLLYAAPLLTAVIVMRVVQRREHILLLRTALYVAAVLGAVVGLVPALAGDTLGGSFDPEGRLLHRSFGTFLIPLMALVLARLRYGELRQGVLALLLFALALATLSRVTVGAITVLALIAMAGTPLRVRAAIAAVLVLFVTAVSLYDPLRERIFADERRGFTARIGVVGSGRSAQLDIGGLQLSGRGLVWLQTWSNALRAPILGHGTGSATAYLAERTRGGALFPHNEYLRIFHDLGVLGAASVLAALTLPLLAFRKLRHASVSAMSRELALAAYLCWMAVALISLFDNALVYFVFFTHNVFLLSALALRSAQLDAAA